MELMPKTIEFGIVGLVLVVMWRLLELLKMWWLTKDGKASGGGHYMTKLQCMTDPTHFERIKCMAKQLDWSHAYDKQNEPAMKLIREGLPAGKFGCTWKDRDEVLDMIHAIKENTTAMNYLTAELRKQNGRN